MSTRNLHGASLGRVNPGGWYYSNDPGGWTDVTTGLHIPGPKVKLDEKTRAVVAVTEMPAPVQMPTHKRIRVCTNPDDARRGRGAPTYTYSEIPFDQAEDDELRLHEVFNVAISTGSIHELSDDHVREHWPEAYAAKQDRIVFVKERAATPIADLISQFARDQKAERERADHSRALASAAHGKTP